MKRNEFQESMTNFAGFFGKKVTDQQLDKWFGKFGYLNKVFFDGIIDEVTETERSFPTIKGFSEYLRSKPDKEAPNGCVNCNHTGFISCRKKDSNSAHYAFRCDCKLGKSLSHRIPSYGYHCENKGYEKIYK